MSGSETQQSTDRIIDAAMKAAESQGWTSLTLYDIADEAKMPLDAFYEAVGSKQAILTLFSRRVDKASWGTLNEIRQTLCETGCLNSFSRVLMRCCLTGEA